MPVYYVTIRGKEYTVEVPNPREQPVRAIVDGEVIEVNVATSTPVPAPVVVKPEPVVQPAPAAPPAGALDEIKAPLPGTVVSISVSVGDTVQRGQELCILEAMKMNNPIRANRPGVVRQILVNVGQQVQHGTSLMTLED